MMMTDFLVTQISCLMDLIIQTRLVAEALRVKTISEWLLIRKQFKTGAAFQFCRDVAHVTNRLLPKKR